MSTTITPNLRILSRTASAPVTSLESKDMPELIRRHVTEENVCVLTFDRPGSTANIFDRDALLELNGHLNWIVCNADLKGLVLTSAKSSIFIAGADLQSLSKAATPEELREIVELGQAP